MTGESTVADEAARATRPVAHRRRRRWAAAAVGVALIVVAAAIVGLRADPADPADPAAPFRIELAGPDAIEAGESWTFEVAAPEIDADATATVTVSGPWGSGDLMADVVDGTITVPGSTMTRSGVSTATVQIREGTGTVSVAVEPGRAVDGTTPLAGPRSMVADLRHWTMVSAFPRDRYGNVIADGSQVDVVVRRPDGTVERVATEVRHLVAALRVFSTTVAGRSTFRVAVDGATGPEVEVLEVPGPPVAFALAENGPPLRADGRQLFVVTTDRLVDRHGNELLDGTAAVATMDAPNGRSTITSVTIDGTAEFVIETPTLAGPMSIDVVVDGVRSAPLRLDVAPDVTDLPVRVDVVDGLLRVEVGPVVSGLGGFVPDGTEAEIVIGGRTETIALVDGVGMLELPWPPGDDGEVDDPDAPGRKLPAAVTVRVLGVARAVTPG